MMKVGALALLGFEAERAVVALGDDVVAEREAQARALAGGLGGEKGLKDFLAHGFGDAGAVVAHPDLDVAAGAAVGVLTLTVGT